MPVRLYVLGVLNERNAHGYEIRNFAQEADLAQWAAIGYGSIYHALKRLEEEQLVQRAVTEQEGAYPQRTVYRITGAGRRKFHDLLRETCRNVQEPKYPLDLALVFIGQLPPEERVAVLRERLQTLQSVQRVVGQKRNQIRDMGDDFSSLRAVLDHDFMLREAEIRWMQNLIEEVPHWPATVVPGAEREDGERGD